MIFLCPHCKSKAIVRNSLMINNLMRQLLFVCSDVKCGHKFNAWLEAYCTLSPSAKPNPDVHLPMDESVRRQLFEHTTLASTWRNASLLKPASGQHAPVVDRVKRRPTLTLPSPDALMQALYRAQ